MDEATRKGLCEFIGVFDDRMHHFYTFSTPADAQVVMEALEKAGRWDKFYFYVKRKYVLIANSYPPIDHDVSRWLWSYTRDSSGNVVGYRLCELAGEFTREDR